jgi:hypothetical protein
LAAKQFLLSCLCHFCGKNYPVLLQNSPFWQNPLYFSIVPKPKILLLMLWFYPSTQNNCACLPTKAVFVALILPIV